MNKLNLKRRNFLKSIALGNCIAATGWSSLSLAARGKLEAHKLSDRLTLISGAGGNVVMFEGAEGLTLVDSGLSDNAHDLLSLIGKLSSAPVKTLFNTHWHEDHSGGNEAFNAVNTNIIAHENTKLWLGADFDVQWRAYSHKPRPPQALPNTTFYTSGQLDLGSEIVKYNHAPLAHTDGDIYLYFTESNVLVAGGLLSDGSYPICDIATGGWLGGLISANAELLELINDNTIIIPDRGPVKSKADLQAQHDMLADIYEQMKSLMQQGFSGQEMLDKGFTANYDKVWGDPSEFVLETYRGMWAHTYDMGGFI